MIRKPVVAGMFYPGSPAQLWSDVRAMLAEIPGRTGAGKVIAAIVPHAGYVYSGKTAAAAYAALRQSDAETIVIVSPSHREYFFGASIYEGDAYETPLGIIEIDTVLRSRLVKSDEHIVSGVEGHRAEHAIEVQLPFLQEVLPGKKILPIVMGDQRRQLCFLLAQKLAECLKGKPVVMIASSDLSHFYRYEVAEQLDQIVIDDINQFDYEKLMNDLESEKTEACGGGPIVAVLMAAGQLGGTKASVLAHCNSGDVTGDREGVVGYMAAIVESVVVH
ncbi:MAG: AmmeMemoRadiSam system protein B [Bacteroidota bacterium]